MPKESSAPPPVHPDPFHNVGKLFPGETRPPATVDSRDTVGSALKVMLRRRYSIVPVTNSGRVVGAFSLWTLAGLAAMGKRVVLSDMVLDDVMQPPIRTVTVQESLEEVLRILERDEAVLVGDRAAPQAIATTWDVLNYFYNAARAFVLLGEIELAIRDIIASSITADELPAAADRSLAQAYTTRGTRVPTLLHDMTFDDYRSLVTNKVNWPFFEKSLGRNRELTDTRLASVRDIRNVVFHFRAEISVEDYDTLVGVRDWLIDRTRRGHESREVPER